MEVCKLPFEMGIFSSHNSHITIVIDIGSSSIGVSSVLLCRGKKPKILNTIRKDLIFQENFRFERFVVSMLDTLEKVTQEFSHLSLPSLSDRTFLCILASPWYASQTRIFKKTFEHPMKIDEKFLDEVYKKEIKVFKQQEMGIMGKDAVILEVESIQTKLNGYETTIPFRKEASDFQTAIYLSISPHKIIHGITEKIRKAFHCEDLHFSSFPFASFVTVRDIFHEKNFLLMDISGEVTDISLVRDNVLQETVSFSLGRNFLIRKIVSEVGFTFQEASSQFHMASAMEMTERDMKKIRKAMKKAGEEWLSECKSVFIPVIEKQEIIPRDVFITADNDISKWFIENVQGLGNPSFSLKDNTFNVRHLNTHFLSTFCETETGVERDSFLMIGGLFARRLVF